MSAMQVFTEVELLSVLLFAYLQVSRFAYKYFLIVIIFSGLTSVFP